MQRLLDAQTANQQLLSRLENVRSSLRNKRGEGDYWKIDGGEAHGRVTVQDRTKRGTLIDDLQSKQSYLIDQYSEKEAHEKTLAWIGAVQFIHKTYAEAHQELRADARQYKRDLHRTKEILDEMTGVFESKCHYSDIKEFDRAKANFEGLLALKEQFQLA